MNEIHRFDYHTWLAGITKNRGYRDDNPSRAWLGGVTIPEAYEMAKHGNDAAVIEAEKFIAKLPSIAMPDTQQFQTIRSPFGSRVNFSEWQQGTPTPCRRRVRRASDLAPLRVVVGAFASAGVSADTLKKRAHAIIALLLLVQRSRPVDLYSLTESTHTGNNGWRYLLLQLDSRPMNLSQIGAVIGHPCFFRGPVIDWFQNTATASHVPCLHSTLDEQRERLGLSADDIVINKAALHDSLLSNPLEWLTNELKKLGML